MKEILGMISLAIFGFMLVVSITNFLLKYQCKAHAEIQNFEYSYGFFQGCMVKDKDGNWIDYQKYRTIANVEIAR